MIAAFTTVSRFTLLIFLGSYLFDSFRVLKNERPERVRNFLYYKQSVILYAFFINANLVLYFNSKKQIYLILTVLEAAFFLALFLIYQKIYERGERSLVNHMAMLLAIGFVIQSRLNTSQAIRQFAIACVSLVIAAVLPALLRRYQDFTDYEVVYAVLGIALLGAVLVLGRTEYGAKLALSFGPVRFQPSEFVKLLFVLFLASGMKDARESKENGKRVLLVVTFIAFLHILILAACRDLGSASIFFVIYLVMYYCYSRHWWVLPAGGGLIVIALFLADHLFSHVHARILAWLDPLSVIDTSGYQVSQSLFALGTGGWFGSGLLQGMPEKVPVVSKDFVFAAIGEEFGGLFAIFLIFVCLASFLLMMNTALTVHEESLRLAATGLGVCYGFQLFLSIGGVIKFIPSTGVTMPFISYGGSSLLSSVLLFTMIQGILIRDRKGGRYADR